MLKTMPSFYRIKPLIVFMLLFVILLSNAILACEHGAPLQIKNGTDQVLVLFADSTDLNNIPERPRIPLGNVKPGEECKPNKIGDTFNTYLIEARNEKGILVYSRVFDRKELENMNWTVTITSP